MTKLPQAVATVQVDNERVRVTEWRFAPGALSIAVFFVSSVSSW